MARPLVFLSYSRKDETEKDQLMAQLLVLQHAGLIELWVDDRIGGGADWEAEIKQAMARAKIAILLISANFLTSEFILGREVPGFLKRRQDEGLTVFPVIAKPCAWQTFEWLAQMNVRPRNGRSVWGGDPSRVDADLAAIVEEVVRLIQEGGPGAAPANPASTVSGQSQTTSALAASPEGYNLRNIRKLVTDAFKVEELRQLCYEVPEFRPVYDNYAEERKDSLVRHLIEHCERKGYLATLLAIIKEDVPDKYAAYKDRLGVAAAPPAAAAGASGPSSRPGQVSDLEHVQALIDKKKRRLYHLERQKAQYGLSTPPEIHIQIEDLQEELEDLEQRYHTLTN